MPGTTNHATLRPPDAARVAPTLGRQCGSAGTRLVAGVPHRARLVAVRVHARWARRPVPGSSDAGRPNTLLVPSAL